MSALLPMSTQGMGQAEESRASLICWRAFVSARYELRSMMEKTSTKPSAQAAVSGLHSATSEQQHSSAGRAGHVSRISNITVSLSTIASYLYRVSEKKTSRVENEILKFADLLFLQKFYLNICIFSIWFVQTNFLVKLFCITIWNFSLHIYQFDGRIHQYIA